MKKKVEVSIGDRWAILGGTGSGKTTLCKSILWDIVNKTNHSIPVYLLDSKISGDFKEMYRRGSGKLYTGNELPPIHEPRKFGAFQVWQPLEDDKELYNEYFKQIYETRQPAIVFVDEMSSVTGITGTPPRYMDILLKQGRGLNIGFFGISQSSGYLPFSFLRQTTHLIKMRLDSSKDAKKLEDYLGKDAHLAPLHEHGFYYRNITKPIATNKTIYYKNISDFLE